MSNARLPVLEKFIGDLRATMIAGHDEGISSLITIANKTICSIA
jgi:hypothetical protein